MDKYYRTQDMMTPDERKEYLKRYQASGKKKKLPKKPKGKGTRIVDDDVVVAAAGEDADNGLLDAPDERPQVAGVTSDAPVVPTAGEKRWKTLEECDLDELESQREILSKSLKLLEGSNTALVSSSSEEDEDDDDEEESSPTKPSDRRRHDSESSGGGLVTSESDSESDSESGRGGKRDSDASPPRRRADRGRHDSDASPERKRDARHDSDGSPPRRRGGSDTAESTAKRQKPRPGSEGSPRRHGKRADSSDDQSPPRNRAEHADRRRDSDESSARRRTGGESSRTRHDSDPSPPRRRPVEKDGAASSDASHRRVSDKREPTARSSDPGQRRGHADGREHDRRAPHRPRRDSDASPPRRARANGDRAASAESGSPPRSWRRPGNSGHAEPPPGAPPSHTQDGRKAGLQDISALREENRTVRHREKATIEELDDSLTGRHAETKVRGRKLQENTEKAAKQAEEEAKARERKKKYDVWGKGLKQAEERRTRVEHHQHEASKPLARYADDQDLENELRHKQRQDDPMAEYIQRKKVKQTATLKERPRYNKTEPPPNRYGIWPGYRWDGVDRSNGFEKDWFLRRNAKKARDVEAYKWSTEDM